MQHNDWVHSAEEALYASWPELLRDLNQLIGIESTRGASAPGAPFGQGPAKALAFVLRRAREMGLDVQNWDGYVGSADYGPREPGLDILTHLDVVPAGENWKITQPFEPRQVGNRLYGRGAADDKGPTIAVLYALLAVKQSGAKLRHRVRLIWGCAEETGAEDIRVYYSAVPPSLMTVTPDAAFPVINSEKGRLECRFEKEVAPNSLVRHLCGGGAANAVPDSAQAILAADPKQVQAVLSTLQAGQCSLEVGADGLCCLKAHGTAAHAASPSKGCNALSILLGVIAACPGAPDWVGSLARLFPPQGAIRQVSEDETVTASLGAMKLENGKLTGVCEKRYPPTVCAEEERDALLRSLEESDFMAEVSSFSQAHCVPSDSHFVRTLLECYQDAGGEDGCCRAIAGNTYAHSIPGAVAFGFAHPVIRTGTHGADEYVDLDQLRFGARVYIRAIIELCCGDAND